MCQIKYLNIAERNSTEAEREFVKTKLLEFYERELQKSEKQSFEAIIAKQKVLFLIQPALLLELSVLCFFAVNYSRASHLSNV